MRIEHILSLRADARRPMRVLVVGAGGTGSAITMGLPYLDQALRVWGRFAGLDVLLMDADTVSETNCIRQPFSVSDIGQNKATVLVNRINLFWGTNWQAEPRDFDERTFERIQDTSIDFLIGCVDSRAARSVIARSLVKSKARKLAPPISPRSPPPTCSPPTARSRANREAHPLTRAQLRGRGRLPREGTSTPGPRLHAAGRESMGTSAFSWRGLR